MASGALLMPSMALYSYEQQGTGLMSLSATRHLPLLLIAVVMTLVPLISIFLFKDRKRQKGFAIMSILSSVIFYTVMLMRVSAIKNGTPPLVPNSDSYNIIGVVLPVLAIIFLIMAIRGINHDHKLIRDAERLR